MATLTEAQAQLAAWESASLSLAKGAASVSVYGRTVTRSQAAEIREMIAYWQREVATLQAQAAGATHGGIAIAVIAR